ncbi:helix-turn-helix domain-containing protein [Rhodococcus sp. IEGM1300]
MNDIVTETASTIGDALFVFKLDDLMKERGITQSQLASMTGLRVGTISNIVNGKGNNINKVQLLSLMAALRITDVGQLFEVRLPAITQELFETEASEWISSKEIPETLKHMYRKNLLSSARIDY